MAKHISIADPSRNSHYVYPIDIQHDHNPQDPQAPIGTNVHLNHTPTPKPPFRLFGRRKLPNERPIKKHRKKTKWSRPSLIISGPVHADLGPYGEPAFFGTLVPNHSHAIPPIPPDLSKPRPFRESFFPRKNVGSKRRSPLTTPKHSVKSSRPQASRIKNVFRLSQSSGDSALVSQPSPLSEPTPSNFRTSNPKKQQYKFRTPGNSERILMLSPINDIRKRASDEAEREDSLHLDNLILDPVLTRRCDAFAREIDGTRPTSETSTAAARSTILSRDSPPVIRHPYMENLRRSIGLGQSDGESMFAGRATSTGSSQLTDRFPSTAPKCKPGEAMMTKRATVTSSNYDRDQDLHSSAALSDNLLNHLSRPFSVASLTPAPLSTSKAYSYASRRSTASQTAPLPLTLSKAALPLAVPLNPYTASARLCSHPAASQNDATDYWYQGRFATHSSISRRHRLAKPLNTHASTSTFGSGTHRGYGDGGGALWCNCHRRADYAVLTYEGWDAVGVARTASGQWIVEFGGCEEDVLAGDGEESGVWEGERARNASLPKRARERAGVYEGT